MLFRNRPASMM